MEIIRHASNGFVIAEVKSGELLIASAEDGLDLLGTLYFEGYDRMILYESALAPGFFDLKTGIAGEILQKFSNYRMRLAIVGDFGKYESKSLQQFILESNQGRHVCFVISIAEALKRLAE